MNPRGCGNLLAMVAASYFVSASPFEATAATPANVVGTLSTQAHVGTGGNVLMSGIIISGSGSKQVLVRGLGGSLPVAGALVDPVIELRDPTGETIASNDNWKDAQQAAIEQTGYAPTRDAESAVLVTLAPGNYTVSLHGKNSGIGVGKVDIIDVDSTTSARFDNLSSRAVAAAGDHVLVGAFVINGPQSRKVIVRGIGPSLAVYLAGAMRNPTLRLRDSGGNLLVFNDNWEDTQRAAIIDSTVPPSHTRESAIVAALAPGSYTAELIGTCRGGGVALVEVYDLGAAEAPAPLPASSSTPTCFTTWATDRELAGAAAPREADPDGDGIRNFLEYALGKNPGVPDGPGTTLGMLEVQGERYLSLSFTRPTGDDAPDDIDYTIERATALAPSGNWSAAWTNFVTHSITAGPGDLETVTVRSTQSTYGVRRQFLRLKLTSTAP